MLESLTIKNTAVIDHLEVDLGEGLNCLTGETGAGKSIIIDAICCLLGERVSKDSIRRGCTCASVSGVFNFKGEKVKRILEEAGIEPEEDGTLILGREYNTAGKNTCRVNGNIVTLSTMRSIGECLVDVHGQHDNHSLLMPGTHVTLLDSFAGKELFDLKEKYTSSYKRLKEINAEIDELTGEGGDRASAIDLLTYQVNEISAASLKIGEDEELAQKRNIISNSEKIADALRNAFGGIIGDGSYDGAGASDLVGEAVSAMEKIAEYGSEYRKILDNLREASYLLDDAGESLRNALDEELYDPEEAERIDGRLDTIYEMKRKYGRTIEDILAFLDKAQTKLEKLSGSEGRIIELNDEKKRVLSQMMNLSIKMHSERLKASKTLTQGVLANLADMEMGKVRFDAKVTFSDAQTPESAQFTKNGLDNVEFMIAANPGDELKPLAKVASGGELSRIMLAIKSVLADVDDIPVLIFDEIDTGISGSAAAKVASKFAGISRCHQVLCVSHLAQIAAAADHNIFVGKNVSDTEAVTYVKILDEEGKICEIGRLIDGDLFDETTMKHAKSLIERMRKA